MALITKDLDYSVESSTSPIPKELNYSIITNLLIDLKAELGITGTDSDAYLLKYMLVPAVNQATILSLNLKMTTVSLTAGTQEYDLTSSSIASPVVSAAGIQELIWEDGYDWAYNYKIDFQIKNKTTLYFVDSTVPSTGELEFKYNEWFTDPTDSADGNVPTILKPAVLKWSTAEYGLKQLDKMTGVADGSGPVVSKSEESQTVTYGGITPQRRGLMESKREAENEMIDKGANSKFDWFSIQVI